VNVEDKISRLEDLLARVRKNSAAPRERVELQAAAEPVAAEPEPNGNGAAAEEYYDEEEVEDLELSEEDIVDLTEAEEAPQPAVAAAELDWEDEELEAPASSRRPIAAPSMDQAIASAAEEPVAMEEGREIPLKTPPPESGPQEAPPMPAHAPLPEIAEEADLYSGTHATAAPVNEAMLDFEEPPPQAIEVLPPEPAAEPEPAIEAMPESGEIAPAVVARPAPVAPVAPSAYVVAARGFAPASFGELLDASLGLGAGN
jgi:hypothetical protein